MRYRFVALNTDPLLPSLKVQSPCASVMRPEREVVVVVSVEPDHLPKCPIDPERYERLYAFNHGTDDFLDHDANWQEIRIRPGLAEDAV